MKTVMVIEDQESVLRLMQRILQRQNYRVLAFNKGEDAWQCLCQDKSIDVVILDVHLPHVSGEVWFSKIREQNSHVCILLVSGMPKTENIEAFVQQPGVAFLQKPYDNKVLLDLVASLLDQQPAR